MKKLPFLIFVSMFLFNSCNNELETPFEETETSIIQYDFDVQEMLGNLQEAALHVGKVILDEEARSEVIEGVTITADLGRDHMVRIADLLYPEETEHFSRSKAKPNSFSSRFFEVNANTRAGKLTRLLKYLERHGFVIYAPYNDYFDWRKISTVTMSYHPIHQDEENVGYVFNIKSPTAPISEVIVNDAYAKENPSLLIIPKELSEGGEDYSVPEFNENQRAPGSGDDGSGGGGGSGGGSSCDPQNNPNPGLQCSDLPSDRRYIQATMNSARLNDHLDAGLFGGGSEVMVTGIFFDYVSSVLRHQVQYLKELYWTRSSIGTWKSVSKNVPGTGDGYWRANEQYEIVIIFLDLDSGGSYRTWNGYLQNNENYPHETYWLHQMAYKTGSFDPTFTVNLCNFLSYNDNCPIYTSGSPSVSTTYNIYGP